MRIRLAGLVNDSIVDGPGLRLAIFTQGCPHHCPECHNPQSHDPEGGEWHDTEVLAALAAENILLDGITLTGGGAQLLGLDALIHSETGIPAHVSKNPLDAVVMGAGRIVDDPATMRLIDAARA